MKKLMRKLKFQCDDFTNNVQRKFDSMDEEEYEKKIDFHEELTSIQISQYGAPDTSYQLKAMFDTPAVISLPFEGDPSVGGGTGGTK